MKKIVFLLPNLNGGGAEKVFVTLLNYIKDKDIKLILVVTKLKGDYIEDLPENLEVIDLKVKRFWSAFLPLLRCLNKIKPNTIISTLTGMNLMLLSIKPFIRGRPKIVIRETNPPSIRFRSRITMNLAYKIFYPTADAIIAISRGVKDDLIKFANIKDTNKVKVIYNPINVMEIKDKANAPVNHKWLNNKDSIVLIAVGRLQYQKDFHTLIRAFQKVREEYDCKLIILGQGPEYENLVKEAKRLGVEKHIDFPGFLKNPYAYIKKCDYFILSSRWEGFGLVIAEALALNIPVISTNCLGAPKEILGDGKYGDLCPIGDHEAMANLIINNIKKSNNKGTEARALDFDIEEISKQYIDLLDNFKAT